jgi:LysR family transcriptional regulator, benzoate and cis,cis-muconate-responsive activator of ben and cat genes
VKRRGGVFSLDWLNAAHDTSGPRGWGNTSSLVSSCPPGMLRAGMELRHLRYFVAVAEEQNVTRAAARLNVSQPPLTRQIRDLEHELGFQLFLRTGKTVRLTDAGRTFLDEARAVLRRLDEAVEAARTAASGKYGELHIGYAPSPSVGLMSAALRELQRLAPGVRVSLHDMASPEMLAGLRARTLHAALMMQPPPQAMAGIAFEPLQSFAVVVAVPPSHRFARRRSVTIGEVMAEPLVGLSRKEYPDYHAMLRRVLGRSAKVMALAQESDGGMSLVAAVEAGRGIAIVIDATAAAAGARLNYVKFSPPFPRAIMGVAYLNNELTPVTKTLLDILRRRRKP